MYKKTLLELTQKIDILRATLLLRLVLVTAVLIICPVRSTLPHWMGKCFQNISYPLFFYNMVFLIFHKKIAAFLQKYPIILLLDFSIAVGILQIGGGWRSSYFVYTLTTIMLFTLFYNQKGAYFTSITLAIVAFIKNPAKGLPSIKIFNVSNWDMRIGAALFYIVAGCILGYFKTLIDKLEVLSKEKIEETRKVTMIKEKMRLALDLHDSVKSKITAILLVSKSLLQKKNLSEENIDNELHRLWKWLNYLQNELDHVMASLKSEDNEIKTNCNLLTTIQEEVTIIESLTGFSWKILSGSNKVYLPLKYKQPLVKFFNEALMNSWKHSGSTRGTVELKCQNNLATIIITDGGRGFIYQNGAMIKSTGLNSLKHRAKELNGVLTIETSPGKGCKLTLTFPIIEYSKKLPEIL